MNRRSLVRVAAAGAATGLVVAAWMTLLDWRLNPGGIFRGTHGTNWSIVIETGWSWFLPVTIVATAIVLVVLFLVGRRS